MPAKSDLVVEPAAVYEETLPKPLDFAALFGNDHPVELEIGSGKGTFLTAEALARPDTNFFGIEWARLYWRYACDRLRRRGCTNARCLRADAGQFVPAFVPDASLQAVHVYFPDPWPKARHNKRRLLQPDFMDQIVRILRPGGRLQVVTDHLDYWQQIEPIVHDSPLKLVEYRHATGAREGEYVGTNFERKFIGEGRQFHAVAAEKQ